MKRKATILILIFCLSIFLVPHVSSKAYITCDDEAKHGKKCKCNGVCNADSENCEEQAFGCILECVCDWGFIEKGVAVFCEECDKPGRPAKARAYCRVVMGF